MPRAFAIALVIALLAGHTGAQAQQARIDQRFSQLQEKQQTLNAGVRPHTSELHDDNINDEDVKEITRTVAAISDGTITSISGITDGCPCENGPACTMQVRVAIEKPELADSVVLSRINQRWILGPLEAWNLEHDTHQAALQKLPAVANTAAAEKQWQDWMNVEQQMLARFPRASCGSS